MTAYVCAIVPVFNEEGSVQNTLRQLFRAKVQHIIVVCNGCRDRTIERIHAIQNTVPIRIDICAFKMPLGHDVPRAIGSIYALQIGRSITHLLFVDSDWLGSFGPMLESFIQTATDSNHHIVWSTTNSEEVRSWQSVVGDKSPWKMLRDSIPKDIQLICPNTLPMLVQRTTFNSLSSFWLHHPGKWFAYALLAARKGTLSIGADPAWDGRLVGHRGRSYVHNLKMRETLLGDAMEGVCIVQSLRPTRMWHGKRQLGYHPLRRTDILFDWMASVHTAH